MASQENFAQICRRVCVERDWKLLPSGVEVAFPNGRHQLVELEFFQFKDQDLVRFFTMIGDVEQLGPVRLTVALRINCELAHGSLAIREEHLVMTDTLMLDDADFGEIEASIAYLAETADFYEKAIFDTDQF